MRAKETKEAATSKFAERKPQRSVACTAITLGNPERPATLFAFVSPAITSFAWLKAIGCKHANLWGWVKVISCGAI